MSNEVWVTWEDSEGKKMLSTQVEELRDGANIDHLKKAFVKQQEPDIKRPAAIEVREPGKSEILDEEDELRKYFVGTKRETAGTGQSKRTALVLTLPSSSPRTEPPRKRMNIMTEIAIDSVTHKLIQSLREGRIGNTEIKMQGNAQVARLYLRGNPLSLPILSDGETTLSTRLSSESFNLNYLAEQSNIKLVAANSIEDTPIGLWSYISLAEVASWSFRGETEDEIHSYVHNAITEPIGKLFGNTFSISRNKALKTSSGRADYSISSNNLQLFRGEDKMSTRGAGEDPAKELIAKSPKGQQWEALYGSSVPYIFGYYSIGGSDSIELQFVAIPQKGDCPVPLTDAPFDLTKFSGILGCRLFCLSLVPHLLALKKHIKSSFGPDWCIKRRLDGKPLWRSCEVHIGLDSTHGDCCLVKDLYYDMQTSSEEARRWVEKWKALSLPNMPYLLSLRRIDLSAGRVRRVFAPFCKPEAMDGEFVYALEAKKCIAHLSNALKALHDVGLVHNDVRWANVVQKVGEQAEYVLVDYDDLERKNDLGFVPAIEWMDGQSHAPDITSEHNQNVDLWGLCKMISELRCLNGGLQDLIQFGRSCLQKYPESVRDYTAFFMELGRHLEN